MKYWTEMRTALALARLGTVSATAKEIGVHRVTVNRHIDTLDVVFGGPLFQRHARGYTLTDIGRDMLKAAEHAEDIMTDAIGRSRNKAAQLSGKIVLSAVPGMASTVMPAIRDFNYTNPDIEIEFIADPAMARLEYGEAHVAFRAGAKPNEPDYVVRQYRPIRFGLYAGQTYIDKFGFPDLDNLDGHQFVVPIRNDINLPYLKWISDNVRPESVAFRTNDHSVRRLAICKGLGIGFMDDQEAFVLRNLVEIIPPSDDFALDLWVVTHVDLHRTAKIQAFLDHIQKK
ncbi:MAG: LysR family transcriptional regulator [Pseudomonadota bacterium]